uniref:Uncharacterized protein n=1 Tax=Anguilla anguilla TaxID=7936 RepID=A0A0E9Q6H9_ANGAN
MNKKFLFLEINRAK